MEPHTSDRGDYPHPVTARLWEPIQPVDRGERYEDPLRRVLSERRLGAVAGGGSSLTDEGEIQFAELELYLKDLDEALRFVKAVLEHMGAPVGSELLFRRDGAAQAEPFGKSQCLAIYLDGNTLPDEVYAQSDVNDVIADFEAAVAPHGGEFRSYWEGPKETALYLYGPDADVLLSALQQVLVATPLCQNARIVVRHGNPALQPRSLRIPRH